jgi:transcriptional regulator with XRE-family HTH domain
VFPRTFHRDVRGTPNRTQGRDAPPGARSADAQMRPQPMPASGTDGDVIGVSDDALGPVMRRALARSGLTIEEVAERSGVPAEKIRQLAAGETADTFTALYKAVRACGHEVVAAVHPVSEEGEPLRRRVHLHDLVTQLLLATAPAENLRWNPRLRHTPSYMMVGLYGAARQLLHSILILDDDSESYTALPILVRQLWEYTATAMWIFDSPDERVLQLFQDTNRNIEKLAYDCTLDGEHHAEELDRIVENWRGMGRDDESFAKAMPRFEQRLVGFLADRYPMYRDLVALCAPKRFHDRASV